MNWLRAPNPTLLKLTPLSVAGHVCAALNAACRCAGVDRVSMCGAHRALNVDDAVSTPAVSLLKAEYCVCRVRV